MIKKYNIDNTIEAKKSVKLKVNKSVIDTKIITKDEICDNFNLIGYVSINSKPQKNTKRVLVTKDKYNNEQHIPISQEPTGKIIGYIKTDNEYIGVCESKNLFLWILIALGFVSLVFVYTMSDSNDVLIGENGYADTVVSGGLVNNDGLPSAAAGMISYAGYDNIYATSDSPYILLENLEMNDVDFTYEIKLETTGEVILEETGYIAPGRAIQWDAKSTLEVGEYEVSFLIRTYSKPDKNGNRKPYNPVVMDDIKLVIYE